METVAKILGHSSTRITRSTYAKLLDSTVADKMLEAEEKLGA
jgi:integrase